jgi:hypothetical protein
MTMRYEVRHEGYTVKLDIQCSLTTCAEKPGKFCRFFGAVSFGQRPVCLLFPDEQRGEPYTRLEEKDGWATV